MFAMVTLSGGDLGGQVHPWPDEQNEQVIDGLIYRLSSPDQAVFVGVAEQ